MVQRTAIALGSNLGNRLSHLKAARDHLRLISAPDQPFLQSAIYQTSPVACPEGSQDFYNSVVEFAFDGTSDELLEATKSIQTELGRGLCPERNAPRVIDLDILYLGDRRIESDSLTLPHPRLTSRRFVLLPLCDVDPDLVLPGDDVTIAEHLRHLDSEEPQPALVQTVW